MMNAINKDNIDETVNFEEFASCKNFLLNLYIGDKRVNEITLGNGTVVKMEDIPDDQVVQRANELRGWITGEAKDD